MRNTNQIFKKTFTIALVAMIMLTPLGAYAQEFTDVPDTDWAAGYISKVNSLGILTGYDDATFRPNRNVTNLEAIVSISRLFEINDEDTQKIIEKHKDFVNEMSLPEWGQKGVAIASEVNFASEEDLRGILSDSGLENVKKVDVCKYLVAAMGLEEEAKSKVIVSLPFKDAAEVEAKDAPYIEVLLDKGIIDKSGDSDGNFNPNDTVNRAVMSKMLSMVYDYMFVHQKLKISFDEDTNDGENNNITGSNEVGNDEEQDQKEPFTITGTITGVLKAGNMMNLKILKDGGEEELYQVVSNTEAILDGKEISIFKIVAGVIVEAVVTNDYDVLSIDATSVEREYSGQLSSIIKGAKSMVVIEDDNNDDIPVVTIDNVAVYINGQAADLDDLKEGDLVNVKIKNDYAIKIVAESKTKEYTGKLTTIDFDNAPIIEIEDPYENIKRFALDDSAVIIRNGEQVDFIDLKLGDQIDLTTEYWDVIKIDARVVRTETKGIVNSIIIANTSKLVVANESGEESTYLLSNDADIKVEGKYKSIYDLRLGHEVSLELESNVIVKLDAKKVEQEFRYIGELIYKNIASSVIMIRTDDGENILINLSQDTIVIDVIGTKKSISTLKTGNELLVVSTNDGVTLMGKNIVIMKESELE